MKTISMKNPKNSLIIHKGSLDSTSRTYWVGFVENVCFKARSKGVIDSANGECKTMCRHMQKAVIKKK